jgi:penicillin-binding protein 2
MKIENGLRLLLLIIFSIIFIQTFRLQIIQGRENSQRAEQNRFKIVTLEAERGLFFDKNGIVLVENNNGKRHYLFAEEFAHVIGYVSEADENDLQLFGVDLGRKVGKIGLEKQENGLLAGIDGGVVEEISATGEKLRSFSKTGSVPGRNIQLSIDKNLQQKAYQILKEKKYKGVVIAGTIDGKLLALVSSPSYDPNIFISQSQEEIAEILNSEDKPMFNRAIAGLYPPASIFKIVPAIAALENGIIDRQTEIEDTGVIRLGDFSYSNWYYTGYGGKDENVNVEKALQRSNDIFFYRVGEQVGITKMADWAQQMGLGKVTGISIEGEVEGLVPTKNWKKEYIGEDWYLGDTYITAIGQGNLQTTPLQIQMLMSTIANDGYLCQPELIASVVDKPIKNIEFDRDIDKGRCQKLPISEETLGIIKNGLRRACEPKGTGWPLFEFKVTNDKLKIDDKNFFKAASESAEMIKIPVACKTGTAEIGGFDQHGEPNQKTHAWFTTFAPVEDPEIVVTVLLEEAGQGSDKAAPVAKEILKMYFEGR